MRLDVYLAESGLAKSRTEAKKYIDEGLVLLSGLPVTKASLDVTGREGEITVRLDGERYVSRGALKLKGALDEFGIDPRDRLCLDVGASSGGFTDLLLRMGARHSIAVDSGTGQLADSLRADPRVTSIEGFNARYMTPEDLEYAPSLACMDVSFISAKLIIPAVFACLCAGGDFVCLIKPQFEVGRAGIGKGGIVKDEKIREKALFDVMEFARSIGFTCLAHIVSPIKGGDGNTEYLAHFKKPL